jgi:hypothetical protein
VRASLFSQLFAAKEQPAKQTLPEDPWSLDRAEREVTAKALYDIPLLLPVIAAFDKHIKQT